MQVTEAMVAAAAKALVEAEATHDCKEPWINHAARAALSAALSIEQTPPVKVKALEWRKPDQRNTLSRAENDLGVYRVWTHFEADGRWFWSLDGYEKASGECSSEDEAQAAAQQDYETRIRSAIVEVPVDIPADLVERCSEIFGWKKTGVLTGDRLRSQARAIREKFNSVFDAGEALRQAEEETKREAMRFIIALSTTRTTDSAEMGGSATSPKGNVDG